MTTPGKTRTGKQLREKLIEIFVGERWQQDAAVRLDVHPATIRRWCKAKRIPVLVDLAVDHVIIDDLARN